MQTWLPFSSTLSFFPLSFRTTKGNLKTPRICLTLRTLKTLKNKQKTLKKTKEFRSKKTPRKQKHQGKEGQCRDCTRPLLVQPPPPALQCPLFMPLIVPLILPLAVLLLMSLKGLRKPPWPESLPGRTPQNAAWEEEYLRGWLAIVSASYRIESPETQKIGEK